MKACLKMDKPDWSKEEDYQYTYGMELSAWAWEFLRRDQDYRADYALYTSRAKILAKQYKDWRHNLEAYCYVPEKAEELTRKQWELDCADRGVVPERVRLDHLMGQRWHLKGMFDPYKDFNQGITFKKLFVFPAFANALDELHEFTSEEIVYTPNSIPTGMIGDVFPKEYAVVVFDLAHDLPAQIKKAGADLKKRAKGIEADNTFLKQNAWVRHLRVLDAINSASPPSNEELAKVLGYNEEREKQNDEPPAKIGFEYLEAATTAVKRIPLKILRRISSN